jgi:hypothetical protein
MRSILRKLIWIQFQRIDSLKFLFQEQAIQGPDTLKAGFMLLTNY